MIQEEKKTDQITEKEYDPQAFLKVKELVLSLANTISALKIFPAHHSSAIHFRQDFISKLKSFLDQYQKLELEIGEFSFFFQGKQVFQDEISSKSLPFFFYKDGLRLLVLYQGMDEQEMNDFLELVRTESAKASEESDMVNALWLKDLPNVQYYAPEEFIENRILEERVETLSKKGLQIIPQELANKVVEINVNRENLFSGQLELKPEEKQALETFEDQEVPELPENWQQTLSFEPGEEKDELTETRVEKVGPKLPTQITLNQQEIETLNRLVEKNRQLSPAEEFLNLMMEILDLEKDLNQFGANLQILRDFYQENIKTGNFEVPILLGRKIRELKSLLSPEQPEKVSALEGFLASTSDLKILDEIKKLVEDKVELNYSALFDYLNQFGDSALPFLTELFEKIDQPEFRENVRKLFQNKLQAEPGLVSLLIDDQKPVLTEAIIEIMGQQPGPKIISQFSNFLTLTNRNLKIKAIEVLSSFNEEMANKILMGFLNDPDEEIRIKATTSLKFLGDISKLKHLMKDIFSKKFREKHFEEKKALFEFLGRTRNREAFNFLKKVFLKKSFLPSTTELRICAAAGLEAMQTDEAIELLRRGERFFNRKVREAASEALVRLTLKNSKGKENG
ncbi:MAG: HEAT repeat domain-containing protein [Candidatus Saccharicenans sp.]